MRKLMWRISAVVILVGLLAVEGRAQTPIWHVSFVFTVEVVEYGEPWFQRVRDIGVDHHGGIWVLDSGRRRVMNFDPYGGLLSVVGGEGVGPGEFSVPVALSADSTLKVFDGQLRRVTEFSLVGELIETRLLPSLGGVQPAVAFPMRNGRLVAATAARHAPGHAAHDPYQHVLIVGENGRVDTVASIAAGTAIYFQDRRGRSWGVRQTPYGDGGAWGISGDSMVVVADGYAGTVRWLVMGQGGVVDLRRQSTIPDRPRPVSEQDRAALRERFAAEIPDYPPRVEIVAPLMWSVASRVIIDHTERTWVRVGRTEGAETWLVFGPDGHETGRVVLPAGFGLLHGHEDRLYGVVELANGVQTVGVLRVIKPPRRG